MQREGAPAGWGWALRCAPSLPPASPLRQGQPLCHMGLPGAAVSLSEGGCWVPGLRQALASAHTPTHPTGTHSNVTLTVIHAHTQTYPCTLRLRTQHTHAHLHAWAHTPREHTAGCACVSSLAHTCALTPRHTCMYHRHMHSSSHLGWLRGRQGPLPAQGEGSSWPQPGAGRGDQRSCLGSGPGRPTGQPLSCGGDHTGAGGRLGCRPGSGRAMGPGDCRALAGATETASPLVPREGFTLSDPSESNVGAH